ncbi:uncharacterized protein LOC143185757 isoform X2 [Calliopsis andreniformis]|uniref:uncharacterized protein LOC143185757 isoform X2 n=1 Tax=Calliopsis andreniformis TaxID=337506 RepID=UPI003FCE90AD
MGEPARAPQKKPETVQSRGSDDSTCLTVANYVEVENLSLPKVPKRKLSVFYKSFDVIARNQGELSEFRRTSSSPSVRIERTPEVESRGEEIYQQTSPCRKGLVNNYRLLIESGKFLSSSSPDRLTSEVPLDGAQFPTKVAPQSSAALKLPQVRESKSVDDYSSSGSQTGSNSGENGEFKDADERVSTESLKPSKLCLLTSAKTSASEESENGQTSSQTLPKVRAKSTSAILRKDLVRIKDSPNPRPFANSSSASLQGRYTSVDPEMSSQKDSSIGSDSKEDRLQRGANVERSVELKGNIPLRPSSFSNGGLPTKVDSSGSALEKTGDLVGCHSKQEKRQRLFAARRSLSEGDSKRYQLVRHSCGCSKWKKSPTEQEKVIAFPCFEDLQLQSMGLSTSQDTDTLFRENIPENELERKYLAFSIGLSTDRITLQRRMSFSRRNRDLAERNLMSEIQQMYEDIEELSPLCTDSESIEKVEKVRHRLDMVMRCAHKVSCAAETLGAMCQEQKVSRAIFFADKYLQTLRLRCENLTSEIAEAKRVLLENNIVMEETTELGDDLPKIRYKNGLSSNNRTMIARRRASIATIPRPLTSQDIIKAMDGPRPLNSSYGKIIRRPSLCSEVPRWEYEKPNRTDFNSIVELRHIFEQMESRRNSVEENNNLPRNNQNSNSDTVNITNNVDEADRLSNQPNFFLESNVTKNVEKQFKLCSRTAESLQIFRDFKEWQQILRYALMFLIGFYIKHIISSNTSVMDHSNSA